MHHLHYLETVVYCQRRPLVTGGEGHSEAALNVTWAAEDETRAPDENASNSHEQDRRIAETLCCKPRTKANENVAGRKCRCNNQTQGSQEETES